MIKQIIVISNFNFSFQICEIEFQSWAILAIGSFRANPYRRGKGGLAIEYDRMTCTPLRTMGNDF